MRSRSCWIRRPFRDLASGTFDPDTRELYIGDPSFTGSGETPNCGALRMESVVSLDGMTMAGNATVTQGFFHGFCFFSTSEFTTTRSTCGNGLVDPGESCDTGDIFSDADCCSPAGALEPAGNSCSSPEHREMPCLPSSVCDGVSLSCPAPTLTDADGDGIVDTCDWCAAGSRLSRVRVHRTRDGFSIVARLGLPGGAVDPVARGIEIVVSGGDTINPGFVYLGPDASTPDTGGWQVKRPGRLWKFHSTRGESRETATVRSAGG